MADESKRPGSRDRFVDDLGDFLEETSAAGPPSKNPAPPPEDHPALDQGSELSLENLDDPAEPAIERAHMPGERVPGRSEPFRAPAPQPFNAPAQAASKRQPPSSEPGRRAPEQTPSTSSFRPAADSFETGDEPVSQPRQPSIEAPPPTQPAPAPAPKAEQPAAPPSSGSGPAAAASNPPLPPKASPASAPPASGPAGLRGMEKAALAGIALVILAGGIAFVSLMLPERTKASADAPEDSLRLPAQGKFLTISKIETYWRDRQDGDAARPEAKFLPAVEIETTGGSGESYLQVLLRDPDGRIRGDAHTFHFDNGRPANADSPRSIAIGTEGYGNPMIFMEYRGNLEKDWTVELLESKEAKAPADQWTRIAYFKMSKRYLQGSAGRTPGS
ncbi:MAG TPA: hypothetical protein VMN36_18070 [Verrucomicrobiales bacterium]|nr:hypothetical protein [Verrucomicrobiales bacterium]